MAAVATGMGFGPLAWLAVLRERRANWWWLAGAFGVSGLVDVMSYGPHPFVDPWLVATVYPVTQAGIVVLILGEQEEARVLVGLLVVVGVLTVLTEGVTGPTLFLETVAAGCVVSVAWPLPPSRLRLCLLTAFAGGLLAWVAYIVMPGLATYLIYQGVRAVSLGLFCWASSERHPSLRLA